MSGYKAKCPNDSVIFMVAVCIVTGKSADQCQPMHNSPIFASLDDCERWIADVAQPDPSVIDMSV